MVQMGTHEGNVLVPQLSPDGATLAYEVNYPAEKRTELWTVPWRDATAAGRPERLAPARSAILLERGAGKRIIHGLAWARTGPHAFAYSVSDSAGTQDIYVDGWSLMVESPGAANKNPTWDPTASRFVFSSGRTGNGDLYLWDGDAGGAELQLTFDSDNGELYPKFNPFGDKVAFVRAGRRGSHVMVLDIHMFTAIALVQWEGVDSTRPSWSPDGSQLAFFSNKASDSVFEFGLWTTDSRPGGSPRLIAPRVKVPSKGAARWTPDGKYVLAVLDDPDQGDPVCFFPVDGGGARCLAGARTVRDPFLTVHEDRWLVIATAQQMAGEDPLLWQTLVVFELEPLP